MNKQITGVFMEHNKLHDYVEARNLIYMFNKSAVEKNAEQRRKYKLPVASHSGGG